MKRVAVILFLIAVWATSCTVSKKFITEEDVELLTGNAGGVPIPIPMSNCRDYNNFAPDQQYPHHTPIRYIRINFHFINSTDKKLNFPEDTGREYAQLLLDCSNDKLLDNRKMFLPKGNDTPVLPIRYQYVLEGVVDDPNDDGIYFHYDDELYVYNKKLNKSSDPHSLFSADHYDKYGVRKGEVINVFLLEHHPDSVASPTYKVSADGVGTPKWSKVAGSFHHFNENFKKHDDRNTVTAKFYAGLLNHELGHSLGLSHTWRTNDGCDDTPKNPNCWNYEKKGPCKEKVSNNVMDYNAYRNAYTPCQLAKVHYNMSRENSQQRKKLVPVWCDYQPDSSIHIMPGEEVAWNNIKDLQGDLVIESGGKLTIHCMVHLPKGGKITVKTGGELVLDKCTLTNRCGEKWQGIEVWKKGGEKGKVVVKGKPLILQSENELVFNK